jgi:hypothetical protein
MNFLLFTNTQKHAVKPKSAIENLFFLQNLAETYQTECFLDPPSSNETIFHRTLMPSTQKWRGKIRFTAPKGLPRVG